MSAVLTRPRLVASSDSEHPAPEARNPQPVIALGAYRSSGGTARGDDLTRLLAEHHRGDCRPVDLMGCELPGVLGAARTDHFIYEG